MNRTSQSKNLQREAEVIQRRFKRSSSRSVSRSHGKTAKIQSFNFFVKNIKPQKLMSKNDLELGTPNLQKMIRNRIILPNKSPNDNKISPNAKTHDTCKLLLNFKQKSQTQTSNRVNFQNYSAASDKQSIQRIMRQKQEIEKEKLSLSEHNQLLKEKILLLQQQLKQLQSEAQNRGTGVMQNICIDASSSKEGYRTAEQTTDNSVLSLLSQNYKNQTLFEIELLYYQAKQQINSLLIELNCERRKHLVQIEHIRRESQREVRRLREDFSQSINAYKQKMKRSFSYWCQIENQYQDKGIKKFPIRKNSSIQLQYSFEDDQQQSAQIDS